MAIKNVGFQNNYLYLKKHGYQIKNMHSSKIGTIPACSKERKTFAGIAAVIIAMYMRSRFAVTPSMSLRFFCLSYACFAAWKKSIKGL